VSQTQTTNLELRRACAHRAWQQFNQAKRAKYYDPTRNNNGVPCNKHAVEE
jgi:hypothetical protein